MPPTIEDRFHDILFAIGRIEDITRGHTLDQFASDELVRMTTERYLEIVCEASRNIPEATKNGAPHIDWRRMIDFGNRLRHAYRTTDTNTVWLIVINYIPALKQFVEDRLHSSND